MTDIEIKKIHILQSRNVRHLKQVQKNLEIDINHYLLKNDAFQVRLKTMFYALLYSALSEAQFLQILFTPKGFLYSEIEKVSNERAIFQKWNLMVDLAISKVGNVTKNKDLAAKCSKIKEIIAEYIEKPQYLRNKIAHGQWIHALNSSNTNENVNTTCSINNLNVVMISKWFEVHQFLCFIIRDLIQSPKKGFHRDYWVNLTNLEFFLSKSDTWTMKKRIDLIKIKFENRKVTT